MPAKDKLTVTTDITVAVREVDFVTRFGKNWDALMQILGIMRPIRKAPGTKLTSYNATMKSASLQGGASVGEGEEIPYTEFQVSPVTYSDIVLEKYAKAVSIEAVAKYGAAIAVQRTDEAFLNELQSKVLTSFYAFLNTGSLIDSAATFQAALAKAKGKVLEKFASMRRTVTDVVGFANINDFYNYLGSAPITVQTAFGMTYIQNFMGYSTLFLCPDVDIASGKVIALPVENIDLYYIDPSDSDFAQLGLNYTVEGQTNLIGFHANGDYAHAVGESFALMGMTLWAEYLDGIAVVYVGTATKVTTAETVTAGSDGKTFNFAHSPVISVEEVKDNSVAVTTGYHMTNKGIVFDTAPTGPVTVKYTYVAQSA